MCYADLMPKGTYGEGSIEPHGRGFRVRFRIGGRLTTVAQRDTQEEAELARQAFLATSASNPPELGRSLASLKREFFDRRVARGKRDVPNEENIWDLHIATAEFATWPIDTVQPRDGERWLDAMLLKRVNYEYGKARNRRKLSTSRIKNALNLMRRAFEHAQKDGLIASNPMSDIQMPERAEGEETTEDAWDWMRVDEQLRFAQADIPPWGRNMVLFALGTGVRKREQFNLELRDVHSDHVIIRFGGHRRRRKTAKAREPLKVPLFGWSLVAVTAQKAWLKDRKNPHGLLFPTPTGCRWDKWGPRSNGRDLFEDWLTAARIRRVLRWHDLRHTCASSLISGSWGRPWSLEEVQGLLGHASRTTTERYAHLAPTSVARAAEKTGELFPDCSLPFADFVKNLGSHLRDLNSRPTVYETVDLVNDREELRRKGNKLGSILLGDF